MRTIKVCGNCKHYKNKRRILPFLKRGLCMHKKNCKRCKGYECIVSPETIRCEWWKKGKSA